MCQVLCEVIHHILLVPHEDTAIEGGQHESRRRENIKKAMRKKGTEFLYEGTGLMVEEMIL